MEYYRSPLVSTNSYSEDYNDIISSIQNLDLENMFCDNQGSSSRYNNHGVFDHVSPQIQYVNWGTPIHGSQLLDHTTWPSHSNGEPLYSHVPSVRGNFVNTSTFSDDERMRINPCSGYSWINNVANQVPGMSVLSDTARIYDPSYMVGSTMDQNGYYTPGFTQSNGLNGYCNQGFTETRSNVRIQEFLDNLQDIASMAMVKEGSMFLQHVLLERNQELRTTILVGVLDHIHQLLMDQYGHHMIDKLVESCEEHELEQILEKLASEPDLLVRAAYRKEGSNSIQKLIKHLKKSLLGLLLTSALAPRVVDLATNKTARHVFRECLNLLCPQANKVLYEEAIKNFDMLARDEVGCLALNDCIDFATNHTEREKILQLVIDKTVSLAYDPYGNYIVQNAVKIPECGVKICEKLRGHYISLSTKKSGSHVVEKCMESCSSAVMQAIEEILEKGKALELARNEYGNYVIQTALRATESSHLQLRNSLVKALLRDLDSLMISKTSKKLVNKILHLRYFCRT